MKYTTFSLILMCLNETCLLNVANSEYNIENEGDPRFRTRTGRREVTRVRYERNQLWKVEINDKNRQVLEQLKNERAVTTWHNNRTTADILINPTFLDYVRHFFESKKVKYCVIMDNVQKAIDAENPPMVYEFDNTKVHKMTWVAYHRLNDIYGFLDQIAETYPNLCTVSTIGYSYEGRPLKVLKISNGHRINKAFWVDGGIHAREWISPATVTYFINELVTNYEQESQGVQSIDWYVLPVVNPDGYEYTHTIDRFWRKNRSGCGPCPGIDLNRNFGHRWGEKGVSKNPCDETYGGKKPFSESETFAIQKFIMSASARWTTFITFHSYGQYILYPWGYDKYAVIKNKRLGCYANKAAAAMRKANGTHYVAGNSAKMLYPVSGGSDDWALGVASFTYAYTIELRDNGRYGFVLPAEYIVPTAQEALIALRVYADAAKIQ